MFRLEDISLTQFRNYSQANFRFEEHVTGFCGQNGSGKTNLLDAVYYLCFTKSYLGKTDVQNVQHGKQGFRLEGNFIVKDQPAKVVGVVRETGKKEFGVDNENYTRMAAHIGKFPCVMIAPDDVAIITEGSEERRKFIDYTLSQLDAAYLQTLIDYNKILQQRNSLLKQFAETAIMDESLFEVLSAQLVQTGNIVFQKRTAFLNEFIPVAINLYNTISGNREILSIAYKSHLQSGDFTNLLREARRKDNALQRTTIGIHRDDIEFGLEGELFKSLASQGQRKSLLFALKLAEFEVLLRHKGFPPILLLDDVFEKLDENRMQNLLAKVCVENGGQVFISDTHCSRLKETLDKLAVRYKIIPL